MEFATPEEKHVRLYFLWSVWLKGIISFAEIVAGTVAFFVAPAAVATALASLIAFAVPPALLETAVRDLSNQSGVFVGIYLLSRGLIKFLLIVALLRDKLWAYPSSLVVLALFVLYQCYQIAVGHSFFIVALTIFDLIVMWFIWREYQILKRMREAVAY